MILGTENIAAVFSIFHDGGIDSCSRMSDRVQMTVDIRYLAERVNPSYKTFTLNLAGVTGFRFKTWPNDASADPQTLTRDTEIFTPDLEILSAETEGEEIKVICNQPLTK